ncbi:oligosaccharide flippase family protein [Listeria aquatica]|uniref:Oligosaccharide flippase family protein n=1 Tax=Listeria aquatica TaxID=1494960 RepID=A0A841ZJZ9_9LIST|nr:oligosaccharide flippase family protein [Listeria aquatica]
MSQTSNILNKFLSISIGSWIAMLIGFVSTPITTRLLSPDQFGQASIFLLVVDVLAAITLLGSDQSFIRFFYEEETSNRKFLLRSSLRISLATFGLAALLILVFYQSFSAFIFSKVSLWLVFLLLLYVFLRIVSTFASLVIRMQQKGKIFSLIQVLNKSLEFLGILFFAYLMGNHYEVIIYAHISFMILVTVIAISVEYKFWRFFGDQVAPLKSDTSERLRYGMPLMVTLLMTLAFQSVDRLAIKEWSNYSELGLYYAAFKIIAVLNMLQINFTAFWTPLSYEKFKENPDNAVFFQKMAQTVIFVMFVIATGVLLFKDVIVYLLGSEYRDAASIMPFLVFIPVMYTISEVTVVGINFYKKTKWHLLIACCVFFINVLGNILLVPLIGAAGAAISTGISYIAFFAMRTYFSTRLFQVDYKLKRFYVGTLFLVSYALYTTFCKQSMWSFGFGLLVLLVISWLYNETLMTLINKCREFMGPYGKKGGKK